MPSPRRQKPSAPPKKTTRFPRDNDDSSLSVRALAFVRKQQKSPPSAQEIARNLHLSPKEIPRLTHLLHTLEKSGDLARVRGDRFTSPSDADLAVGTIQTHRDGSAHLLRDKRGEPEFYISPENAGTALPGDRVVVRYLRDKALHRGYQPCGRVIRILERGTTTAVGTLQKSKRFWCVVPDDRHFSHNIYVPSPAPPLHPAQGDKVVVRLGEWTSRHSAPEGEIIEVLGPANKPGVDIESIIRKFEIPTHFPEDVIAEAQAFPSGVSASAMIGREDCRDTLVVTIDPDDARDFDDAINVMPTADGWKLTVHVADVSHYVLPGTPLDAEAYKRGNSVYLPGRVIPMLPEALSNGLCSLVPNEDRLTFAAFLDVTRDGKIRKARFAKAVIRSARRYTYQEAYARLKVPPKDKFDRLLHEAWAMASVLRKKRFDAGALDLDFPEVKVYLDPQGIPIRLERVENDISHQLIEECMLAANESVARLFRMTPAAGLFRIHEKPDDAKLNEYRERVQMSGYRVGNLSVRKELTRFLRTLGGKPDEYALKTALLKSLKRASYSAEPLGHYGLSKSDYTHFTSPIRRYADLIVHRVLGGICGIAPKRTGKTPRHLSLDQIARHLSTTERRASDAEREAVQLKKFEFFRRQLSKRTGQPFRAVILEARTFGMFVELPDVMASGLIHVSALGDDFYTYDQKRQRFVGRRTKKTYKVGDEIEVVIARADPFKQQLDFAPA